MAYEIRKGVDGWTLTNTRSTLIGTFPEAATAEMVRDLLMGMEADKAELIAALTSGGVVIRRQPSEVTDAATPDAEPAPEGFIAGAWINWPGDQPCPLPPGAYYQPQWRRYHRATPAHEAGPRDVSLWKHRGDTLDVVRFRVLIRKREPRA